jgi:uncharacterized protein YjeT (DUF2065 family)
MLAQVLIALGFVLLLEGLVYAFVPGQLRRLAETLARMPNEHIRLYGLAAIGAGAILIWLVRVFLQT